MKITKILFILFAFSSTLLFGCTSDLKSGEADYLSTISKAQEITAVPLKAPENVRTFSEKEEIDDFITALAPENWSLKSIPETAGEIGVVEFRQDKTIKPGQAKSSADMYKVCSIIVYDAPYIEMDIDGVRLAFEVSPETGDFLNSCF